MAQPITDYAAFFADAKQAVTELSQWKDEREKLEEEEKRLERELQTKERAVADAIEATVKQRTEEISRSYDEESERVQDRLKKVRAKRERAKSQGVRERIEEDTSGLVKENREIAKQLKSLFKRSGVPGLCRSELYYALYFTRGVREALLLLLSVLICFLAIPCGVYFLIPQRRSIYLAGIYLAAILIFGGLYIAVGNRTKVRHLDVMKEGRGLRNRMRANRKQMRAIARAIRKDRNETQYNLGKFDDEIAQLEQDLKQIDNQKREALNTFDTVTQTIISDEIAANNREETERLQADLETAESQLKTALATIKEKALALTDRYEIYVGKEFMTPEKLDILSEIMTEHGAANLSEAIDIYRKGWNPEEMLRQPENRSAKRKEGTGE